MEVKDFLVESALLTHGLASVSDEELAQLWPQDCQSIVWLDKGRLVIGGLDDFLPLRRLRDQVRRVDCYSLDEARQQGLNCALTASATMAVCAELGLTLAVSCGIGGIGDIKGEQLCPDLPALTDLPVCLIATSPKDMLDIAATIAWLKSRGVAVYGCDTAYCSGYIFNGDKVKLSGSLCARQDLGLLKAPALLLNPIDEAKRLQDRDVLQKGISAGLAAQERGAYYHPAVNGEIDRLSGGYSSHIQLEALIANVRLAAAAARGRV